MNDKMIDQFDREYKAGIRIAYGVCAFAAAALLWLFYEMWR